MPGGARTAWPGQILALDGRRWPRGLSLGLLEGDAKLPYSRHPLSQKNQPSALRLAITPATRSLKDRVMSGGDAMQISRRDILGAGATMAAAALTSTETFGGWEASERYPDPAIKVLDPSFLKYRVFNASIERLVTGM